MIDLIPYCYRISYRRLFNKAQTMTNSATYNLKNLSAILWDFDSVLTKPDHRFFNLCDISNPRAACKIIPDLEYEEALYLSNKAFKEHRDTLIGFLPLAKKHNIPEEKLKSGIFTEFFKILYEETIKQIPELFAPNKESISKFEQLSQHVEHCIISHSCAQNWVKPALQLMGKYPFFREDCVLGFNDFNYENKSISPTAILLGMYRLASTPNNTAFVEDTLANLQMAKASCPDITTVWVSEESHTPKGVDIIVKSEDEFADLVINAKLQQLHTSSQIRREFTP